MILHAEQVVLPAGTVPRVQAANIELSGGRITRVRPGEPDEGAERLGDRIVAPAFINAHTHLSMVAFRGLVTGDTSGINIVEEVYFPLERKLTAADVRAFARMGAWECVLAGTGAVFDHYYHAEAIAAALVDVGLCGVVAPTLQDLGGPGVAQLQSAREATLAIAQSTTLADAGVLAALGPHATDTVSPALWDEVAELAHRHDLPVHFHLAQSIEELERSGGSTVDRLTPLLDGTIPLLAVHGLYLSDADLRRLARAGVLLGHCPASQVQFCFPAHLPSWRAMGLDLALGTDAGVNNDGVDVQAELRWLAGETSFAATYGDAHARFRSSGDHAVARQVEEGRVACLDAEEALASVWEAPARWASSLNAGEISAGKRANLIVVDPGHPALWPASDALRALAFGNVAAALDRVVINGREVRLDADLYRAHREEADRRLVELLAR